MLCLPSQPRAEALWCVQAALLVIPLRLEMRSFYEYIAMQYPTRWMTQGTLQVSGRETVFGPDNRSFSRKGRLFAFPLSRLSRIRQQYYGLCDSDFLRFAFQFFFEHVPAGQADFVLLVANNLRNAIPKSRVTLRQVSLSSTMRMCFDMHNRPL
jgi:hypothetical protein